MSESGEADFLDALARRVEFVDGGEGEAEIPTVEALAGWLPMAPETAQKEAGELLKQLPWPRMIIDGHLVKDGDLAHTAWWIPTTTADGRQSLMCVGVFNYQPSDDAARFEYREHCEHPVLLKVEGVHELWRNADPQPRHPLAPLVRAWWKRPQHIEADTHRDAILPAGTLQHAPSTTYHGDRTRAEQFELETFKAQSRPVPSSRRGEPGKGGAAEQGNR